MIEKLGNAKIEFKIKSQLGEGAFWNYKTQELYWVDIDDKYLHIYNPSVKINRTFNTPSKIGTVVPVSKGKVVVALVDGIYVFDLIHKKLILLSNIEHDLTDNRFNDGKCDPAGRLWVGSMSKIMELNKGSLYMVNHFGEAHKKIKDVSISNGIAWSLDNKTMYYIDTPTRNIKAYDFDNEAGLISNQKIILKIPKRMGYPDGMTIDSEGMLWVCLWGGGAVIRCNPRTGKIISKIEVPCPNVTSCAFGGRNFEILYITTARSNMNKKQKQLYGDAGSLFKAYPNVEGRKSVFFNFQNNNDDY